MQDNEWFAGSQDSDLGQIITRGRLFAKGQKQFDSFPMRIEIQWQYKGVGENGMPTDKEAELTEHAINTLTDIVERKDIAILSAIHMGGNMAWFVYYARSIDEMSALINEAFNHFPKLPIQIGATKDAQWSDYQSLLKTFGI